MALNIRIDLNDCYNTQPVTSDLRLIGFHTQLADGDFRKIGISFQDHAHDQLAGIDNLAFGPIDNNNVIDDAVKLNHADHSKLFSTIVLSAISFLTAHPDRLIGIDGSNNARAYLYFRIIQNNFDTLSQHFDIFGLKYYVRILRKAKDTDENYPVDPADITTIPSPIVKGEAIRVEKMYNYFVCRLRQ